MDSKRKMPILPVEAYTSQEWFDKEQEMIFGKTWQFAGLAEDIKDPGDYITVQCGNQNILIVKGQDQELRAFHNLCRHRGTQLLRAVGKKQLAITCPYHDWVYNLTGELESVPEKEIEFPDLKLKKICLHKASVAIWRNIIWVHPEPDVEPIEEWFKGCKDHLGPHNPARLIEYPEMYYEQEINANWKIIVENYIDVYHLTHLHSNTLNQYDHANAEYGFMGNHYMFKQPLSKKYQDNLEKLIDGKRIVEMTDEHLGAYAPWLFPSAGLVESEASWSTFQVVPISPEKSKVIVRTKIEKISTLDYLKSERKNSSYWMKIMGRSTKFTNPGGSDPLSSGDVMEEDIFAIEQQQKSLSNPLFNVVHTAKYGERNIRDFQEIILKWLQQKD